MNTLFWLVVVALVATIAALIWLTRRRAEERQRAEEARIAAFVSGLAPTPKPVDAPAAPANSEIALQKLLFEAAHKAGEANEPALAIQLYARLLARYPTTAFAVQARAAVETQKKKRSKT